MHHQSVCFSLKYWSYINICKISKYCKESKTVKSNCYILLSHCFKIHVLTTFEYIPKTHLAIKNLQYAIMNHCKHFIQMYKPENKYKICIKSQHKVQIFKNTFKRQWNMGCPHILGVKTSTINSPVQVWLGTVVASLSPSFPVSTLVSVIKTQKCPQILNKLNNTHYYEIVTVISYTYHHIVHTPSNQMSSCLDKTLKDT